MTRRSFLVVLGLLLLLIGAVSATLAFLVWHEPEVYAQAAVPPGEDRAKHSEEFLQEFSELYSDATNAEHEWYVQFTDKQINSYLDEGFVQQGLAQRLLPEGVSQPRIVFDEPDKIHLGFRYGAGAWSTIISIDLRLWLANGEPNVVNLELEGFHAGALPIAAQSLLEEASKAARENGVQVEWYRHNGHPTAVLRFQSEQRRATLLLQRVQIQKGSLTIRGRSPDSASSPVHSLLLQLPPGLMAAKAE